MKLDFFAIFGSCDFGASMVGRGCGLADVDLVEAAGLPNSMVLYRLIWDPIWCKAISRRLTDLAWEFLDSDL